MAESLSITTVVLGELVFVLALSTTLLGILLRRQLTQNRRLESLYKKNRAALEEARKRRPQRRQSQGPDKAEESPDDYLSRIKAESVERFQTITGNSLPRLAPEHPFSAKVAALRYLFSEAEERALQKSRATGDPWGLVEKQLYEIARWVAEREQSEPSRQRNNQVRLLQQRVEKLKGFEKLSRDLKRKLELNQSRREELEQLKWEHQQTIQKLQRINNLLSLNQDGPQTADALKHELNQVLHAPPAEPLSEPANRRQLNQIEQIAVDSRRLNGDLVEGLRGYVEAYPNDTRQSLEQTVQRLETELALSERNIQALKARREPENAELTAEQRQGAMENIEETLKIIHTGVSEGAQALGNSLQGGGVSKSLEEIEQLRTNNSRQRYLIIDLEGELQHLRNQLPAASEAPEAHEAQLEELQRLENLVRECEHCILTLESEVDLLYNRLQEQSKHDDTPSEQPPQEALDKELANSGQRMAQLLDQAERDAILSEFALTALHTQTLEDLARALINALKHAELNAGFWLHQERHEAEFFPRKHFSEQDRRVARNTQTTQNVAHLNEGTLVVGPHVHLLLKADSEEAAESDKVEPLVQALVAITGERISNIGLAHQRHTLENWSQTTHNTLLNMEIRYAYQVEEAQRLFDSLSEQVRRVAEVLSADQATQSVLDNALNEGKTRLQRLLTEDEALEKGFDQLLSEVEDLPKALS